MFAVFFGLLCLAAIVIWGETGMRGDRQCGDVVPATLDRVSALSGSYVSYYGVWARDDDGNRFSVDLPVAGSRVGDVVRVQRFCDQQGRLLDYARVAE